MWKRFATAEAGSISVEAALTLSLVMVPMVMGLWNLAQVGLGQAQVQEALQDSITYVAAGNASASGITSAAQSAYGSTLDVSTSAVCYCVPLSSAGMPSTVSCSGSCSGSFDFEQFLAITISKTVTMPFTVPYLGSSVTVNANATVRTG